jgi:hypothetical protein
MLRSLVSVFVGLKSLGSGAIESSFLDWGDCGSLPSLRLKCVMSHESCVDRMLAASLSQFTHQLAGRNSLSGSFMFLQLTCSIHLASLGNKTLCLSAAKARGVSNSAFSGK